MHPSWQAAMPEARALLAQIETNLDEHLAARVSERLAPPRELLMRAFERPIDSVRVLLLGQDPYPAEGDACGLAFAVAPGRALPRSLQNIMRELAADQPGATAGGDLALWSAQGVMLLNRQLTTSAGESLAHQHLGWRGFTELAVAALDRHHARAGLPLVAILWGAQAQSAKPLLSHAVVIESVHPSPLSARRGFFGSKPFSRANAALIAAGAEPLDWSC